MSDSRDIPGKGKEPEDKNTQVAPPRLLPPTQLPAGAPGELQPPSDSEGEGNQGNLWRQPDAVNTSTAAANVPDSSGDEEEIFRMSPHDENPPSVAAGGPSTSKVPSSIVQQKPAKPPHGLKPMLRARYPHETPRSVYPSASTPIPSNCMQYLGPTPGGPGVLAAPTPAQPNIGAPLGVQNHPTKAGALGGDGAGDTAGLHPSESTGERGTSKRKASLGDRLAEFRDRLMKRKKSDCKGPGPKKEDEQ